MTRKPTISPGARAELIERAVRRCTTRWLRTLIVRMARSYGPAALEILYQETVVEIRLTFRELAKAQT
ncbi:MAG TPA: hypothetical protein VKR31_10375 [Rhizomicrobium sp.]|nr:hypothetical protein [Rhizomicrobium sp.]